MTILLEVPYVTQLKPGFEDPTGCWYASACMVAYYFGAGPRQGVPEIHSAVLKGQGWTGFGNTQHLATGSDAAKRAMTWWGKGESEHELLAKREGLVPVPNCDNPSYAFTVEEIEKLLRAKGPIFMYWTKTSGTSTYGHASVIIGAYTDKKLIAYHDPENAPGQVMSIGNFQQQRQAWKYALMQRG